VSFYSRSEDTGELPSRDRAKGCTRKAMMIENRGPESNGQAGFRRCSVEEGQGGRPEDLLYKGSLARRHGSKIGRGRPVVRGSGAFKIQKQGRFLGL